MLKKTIRLHIALLSALLLDLNLAVLHAASAPDKMVGTHSARVMSPSMPRLTIKAEALQAILEELSATDPRPKKVKPQELIDTRYLDEIDKNGFREQLCRKK